MGSSSPVSITIEKILREITAQISIVVRGEVGRALCAGAN